ncbi:ROK family protein [Treponema parvum]|uniref:ROK family protein n=1 Tax=Treponema parvum TaxID=138851 RepID=A0A975IED8_9SPIR|nr:ROK family protein [Treponema parvum]QTQ13861.1 ROK family protein [Treponema parvum]
MKTLLKAQDQSNIKYNNIAIVMEALRSPLNLSRSEIARFFKISPSSATRIVGDLINNKMIIETDLSISNGLGRKATQLTINKAFANYVGFEITDKIINACVIDFCGKIISKSENYYAKESNNITILLNALKETYHKLLKTGKIRKSKIKGIGIGIVGVVNPITGDSIYSDLLKWDNVPIRKIVEDAFHRPVVVDNDIKCAINGEVFEYSSLKLQNVSLISFGRGVAAATIYNGKLLRGNTNGAGEIGHTIVDYSNTQICHCGRKGCASAYLTEEATIDFAKKFDPSISSLDDIQTAVLADKPWTHELIDRISTYMSVLICNLICYQNPENIILRGMLLEKIPSLRTIALDKCAKQHFPPLRDTANFLPDKLKQNAVCVGAAINALKEHTTREIKIIADM